MYDIFEENLMKYLKERCRSSALMVDHFRDKKNNCFVDTDEWYQADKMYHCYLEEYIALDHVLYLLQTKDKDTLKNACQVWGVEIEK